MRHLLVAAVVVVFAGCEPIPLEEAAPSTAPASSAEQQLGLEARLSRGSDLHHCTRVRRRAMQLQDSLAALEAVSPGSREAVRAWVASVVNDVHRADPLVLGELSRLARLRPGVAAHGPTDVLFLVQTLDLSARRQGVATSLTDALGPVLEQVAEGDVDARNQVVEVLAPLAVQLGDLLASLPECAP